MAGRLYHTKNNKGSLIKIITFLVYSFKKAEAFASAQKLFDSYFYGCRFGNLRVIFVSFGGNLNLYLAGAFLGFCPFL